MARSAGRTPKHRGRDTGRQTPYLDMVKATANGGEELAMVLINAQRPTSVIWGKADMARACQYVR